MWGPVRDSLFPPLCLLCAERLAPAERLVCERCFERARRDERRRLFIGSDGVHLEEGEGRFYGRSAVRWNATIGDILHAFKYGGYVSLGERLSRGLAGRMRNDPRLSGASLLLPVPLTRARRIERGFNQSELLARHLSRRLDIPVGSRLVKRTGRSRSQTRLTPDERRKNVRGVFRVTGGRSIDGRKIAVIDDVLTTGATAWELASTLSRAGAREVVLLTVARASGRPRSSPRSSSPDRWRRTIAAMKRFLPATGWSSRSGG